jgi:hypothetical protein
LVGSITRPVDDHRADDAAPVLDDDPPASVRVAFIWLTASAGVMLLLPRQVVSAGICFALSIGTLALHLVLRRRDRVTQRNPIESAPATESQEEEASAPPEPPASSA